MIIDRKNLTFRLIGPIVVITAAILAALALSVKLITSHVIEDFIDRSLSGHAAETLRIMEMAQSDLITARLLDNPSVVEAKKKLAAEAVSLKWQRSDLIGIITSNGGDVVYSSLPADMPPGIAMHSIDQAGHVLLKYGDVEIHGRRFDFPAWNWHVMVAVRSFTHGEVRKEVYYLIPIVVVGSLLIISTFYILMRRNLRRPVESMLKDIRSGGDVGKVGITEFDLLCDTINKSFSSIAERNRELAHELEERRKAENSVVEKESRIRLLLSSAAEGIYGVDAEGICTFCNASCLRILGYQKEDDLLGKHIHDMIHRMRPDGSDYPESECMAHMAFRAGRHIHVDDEVFQRADGTSFPVEYWSYPVINKDVCVGAIVTFFDITERKKAEAKLREEKNKFESIIAALGDGVSIQDRDFTVLYQNDIHKGMIGDHAGEKCYIAFEKRESICPGCPVEKTFLDGKVHHSERTVEFPEGTRFFDITTSPLRGADGNITACIELVRDVTERKRADEHMYHAQRMESVGLLAGGVAHDFNNILSAIFGYTEMLQMEMQADESLKHYIEQILSASERAMGLTKSLLAFSSKQETVLQPVDLNDTVYRFHRMLSRLVGEDIEFKLNLAGPALTVEADRGQLEQVLMNLTTNARDAMPKGGNLQIQTELVGFDEDWGEMPKGSYAVVSVSDTGSGMSPETVKHIFEPFYTTKKVGKGTGLGLSIVYGIIRKHKGYVHVYSEQGKGTTFKIYLPVLSSGETEVERKKSDIAPSGKETILLVEDDRTVREVTAAMLKKFGYSVMEAVDGEEAVKTYVENAGRVDLVLCDLIMPHKDGRETFDEIRKIRPDVKWIYMSGYTSDIISQRAIIEDGIPFMSKPLIPTAVLTRIREVLDGKQSVGSDEDAPEGLPSES